PAASRRSRPRSPKSRSGRCKGVISSPSRARSTSTCRARPARRLLPAALACAALLAMPAGAAAKHFTAANWDVPAQRLVVRSGLMTEAPGGGFQGASPLSAGAAAQVLAALSAQRQASTVAVQSNARITVSRFDSLLVAQLGLADVAAHVQRTAAAAGL